ncbi:hypothetical protein PENTCL1PPCAC_7840, partial [Pristionchus entomophagus]
KTVIHTHPALSMKAILFSSLLLALASGAPVEPVEAATGRPFPIANPPPIDQGIIDRKFRIEEFRKWVGDETVPEEAIAEFFALKISIPFNAEQFAIYKEWSIKWGVDIKVIEDRSNEEMMRNVQKEAARRTKDIFERLGARAVIFDEYAQTGQMSQESQAKWDEINENSTIFERNLVGLITEEMMAAVAKEWGVVAVEGEPEMESEEDPEPEEQQTPEGEEPEVKVPDNESDTEGDEENEEATTSEPEQKPEEEENEQKPDDENDEATPASVIEEEETTNEAEQKTVEQDNEQKPDEVVTPSAASEPTQEIVGDENDDKVQEQETKVEETAAVNEVDEKKGGDEPVDN